MHLSDTSIQSDLHCIECMHRISSCINWESNPYVASSVWAAALEDDGTDIPVDEEPLEAEGVAVPAADARGAAAGTGEGDVVEVRDGTLRAARGHGARAANYYIYVFILK